MREEKGIVMRVRRYGLDIIRAFYAQWSLDA
jgi:hypothetical protein